MIMNWLNNKNCMYSCRNRIDSSFTKCHTVFEDVKISVSIENDFS